MKTIVVSAAIIERGGRILVTRRLEGTHLEGAWEFPGGKCEPGETIEACMARELREELGIEVGIGEEVLSTSHDYPDRRVTLHFLRCDTSDQPAPLIGQEMRWVTRDELDSLEFPPADAELIRILKAK
jgi:mutator protein MutT